jgi:hypothetical protein
LRVQLELDERRKDQLCSLERLTGLKTHTDLYDVALTLLDWSVQQRCEGRIIASLDEKNMTYKELQMPALEYAAKGARKQSQSLTLVGEE